MAEVDRQALYEAVLLGIDALVAHVETLIADALLRDAMTKIQNDTGVDFGPMWKQPKHEDDNEQARKVV